MEIAKLTIILAVVLSPILQGAEEVPALLAKLSSPDLKEKQAATEKLFLLGEKLRESKPALIRACQSNDLYTKMIAGRLLEISEMDLSLLVQQLKNAEPAKRLEAAEKLSLAGPMAIKVVPELIQALVDTNLQVRSTCVMTLRQLPLDSKATVPILLALLKKNIDGDIRGILPVLASMGSEAKEAIPLLLPLLKGSRATQVWATLARLEYSDVSALILQLNQPDSAERKSALEVLAQFGSRANAAVDQVIQLLNDKDPEVAFVAIETLGVIGLASENAQNALIGLMKNENALTRTQAARSIGTMVFGGKASAKMIDALITALQDDNSDVTTFVANALGRIPEAVPALIRTSKGDNPATRRLAIFSLGFLAAKSKEARDAVIAAMSDPSVEMRRAASGCIRFSSLAELKPAIVPLSILVGDVDADVRWNAIESLKRFGADAAPALPALLKAVADKDLKVRAAASSAITAIGPIVTPQVLPLLKAPDAQTRQYALSSLHGFPKSPEIMNACIESMKDPEATVRITAVTVLAGLGPAEDVLAALNVGVRDSNSEVRFASQQVLTAIAPDSKTAQNALVGDPNEKWTPAFILKSKANALSFSPDGKFLATGDMNGTVQLWDSESGKNLATGTVTAQPKGPPYVMSVCFAPDGKRFITGDYLGIGRIWEVPGMKQIGEVALPKGGRQNLIYSPKGDRIAALGQTDGMLWDAANFKEIATLVGQRNHPSNLNFSPDGSSVLLLDGAIFVFDAKTGKQAESIGETFVSSINFSPDGQRLVCASRENEALILNAKTGKLVAKLIGHTKSIKIAIFSPDSARIATVGWDCAIKIWDGNTGKLLQTISVTESLQFGDIAFFPDSMRLAAACRDGAIRIWNVQDGSCLVTLAKPPFDQSNRLAISGDGMHITATGNGNEILIWKRE